MTNYTSNILFIYFSTNNILFNITDLEGNLIKSVTTGSRKTIGVKKISLTALKTVTILLSEILSFKAVHIKCRGISKFKRLTLKLVLKIPNLNVLSLSDVTSLPHNGVRKLKIRRV